MDFLTVSPVSPELVFGSFAPAFFFSFSFSVSFSVTFSVSAADLAEALSGTDLLDIPVAETTAAMGAITPFPNRRLCGAAVVALQAVENMMSAHHASVAL